MRRVRSSKIVATVGPSTSSPEILRELFRQGVDVFRLNFSHGSHEDHQNFYDMIRQIEEEFDRPIGIIADLQGPKLRVGDLAEDSVELVEGQKFTLDRNEGLGDSTRIYLPHPELFQALKPGTDLLIYDGKLRLKVLEVSAKEIQTEVTLGGKLTSHKGVNVPEIELPFSALTDKDRKDLAFALELGADWFALSFVQRPEDVIEARELIGDRAKIIVKVEKPSAAERLLEIMDHADAVMLARGDLGVEIPIEDVPPLQKHVIRTCRDLGKPIIVATQMLDSMVSAPSPTRAEASDVANAVYEGADAVMLSEETAAGKYPLEAVQMMNQIIERVESDDLYRPTLFAYQPDLRSTDADAISVSASSSAEALNAAAIITYTTSGGTALTIARQRPSAPILSISGSDKTARYLSLVWGVHSVKAQDARSFDEMVDVACDVAVREEFALKDDHLVITAGTPFGTPGATNVMRLATVEESHVKKYVKKHLKT